MKGAGKGKGEGEGKKKGRGKEGEKENVGVKNIGETERKDNEEPRRYECE